jgi:hypothetical protein
MSNTENPGQIIILKIQTNKKKNCPCYKNSVTATGSEVLFNYYIVDFQMLSLLFSPFASPMYAV